VAPAQLLNDNISIKKDLADVNWVIAAYLIVRHALVFTGILVLEETLADLVLERSEIFLASLLLLSVRYLLRCPRDSSVQVRSPSLWLGLLLVLLFVLFLFLPVGTSPIIAIPFRLLIVISCGGTRGSKALISAIQLRSRLILEIRTAFSQRGSCSLVEDRRATSSS
jgi:hypothetical protein